MLAHAERYSRLLLAGPSLTSRLLVVPVLRKTREHFHSYQEQCDAILADVHAALDHLDTLQKQYLFVSNKTGTLHEACEQLLKEQVRGARVRGRG